MRRSSEEEKTGHDAPPMTPGMVIPANVVAPVVAPMVAALVDVDR